MANWERKSAYLLREIVKFRTYIDCLQAAQEQKEKIYADRPKSDHKPHTLDNAPAPQTTTAPQQNLEIQETVLPVVGAADT